MKDDRLERLDGARLRIKNAAGVNALLFANEDVPIEATAIDELQALLNLNTTLQRLQEKSRGFVDDNACLERVAVTPDFHKGAGVPVGTVMATRGFVVPAAIGNDVNCGMRLHVTSLKAEQVERALPRIEQAARRTYFEGGRNIPFTRLQREALFREGLRGILNAVPKQQTDGLWRAFHRQMAADLPRVERHGSLPAQSTPGLDDFLGGEALSRDNQIGSIGGGNHFVEIQRVERILDGSAAHAWGLKTGQVTVMVHTGSVAIGHLCGGICREIVRRIYPPNAKQPENGVFLLPDNDRFHAEMQRFWDSLHNAGNFAFANRLFLALMAVDVLRATVGDCDAPLLYDAPHNLVWKQEAGDAPLYVHRKGACPARGPNELAGTPFQYHGEPVLVPGSMGASSFILAGQGCDDSLSSASHGAGRALSRGDALKASDAEFEKFMRNFRVVTPVDFNRPDVKMRRDIVAKKLEDIKKEAPFAYKGIGPVVKTLETAGIARPVAELKPLMTIKG